MKNSLLMSQTALLLLLLGVQVGIAEDKIPFSPSNNVTNSTSPPNLSTFMPPPVSQAPCQNTVQNITFLASLRVMEIKPCEGRLYVDSPSLGVKPLCFTSHIPRNWSRELCKNLRCGKFMGYKDRDAQDAFELTSNLTLKTGNCKTTHIICQELPDALGKELAAYKAVTGILILLILGVILVQFSRPMYKAIRKRFSQKQQNRWIGPTQSQSVSYHRGQGGPNNNTLKRQSYPGLERLTVSTSREPSSNRNSDYDSYGYN